MSARVRKYCYAHRGGYSLAGTKFKNVSATPFEKKLTDKINALEKKLAAQEDT